MSAFQRQSTNRSLLEETKTLLTQITGEGFTHIRRNANGVAHRIAKFTAHVSTFVSWFEEPPDFIVDLLFEDCN
ncbi:hypothetical protein CerSpe_075730 [Prunus speciosa]